MVEMVVSQKFAGFLLRPSDSWKCPFQMSGTNYPMTWWHIPDTLLNHFVQDFHVCNRSHLLGSLGLPFIWVEISKMQSTNASCIHTFSGTADLVSDLPPHPWHKYLGTWDLKIWLLWTISNSSTMEIIIKCTRMCNKAQYGTHIDLNNNNNNLLVIQVIDTFLKHAATLMLAFCSQNKFHSCTVSRHTVSINRLYNHAFTFIILPSSYFTLSYIYIYIYIYTHTAFDLSKTRTILVLTLRPRLERHSIRYLYDQYITCSFVLCSCWCMFDGTVFCAKTVKTETTILPYTWRKSVNDKYRKSRVT
jgi:hypothetical protein